MISLECECGNELIILKVLLGDETCFIIKPCLDCLDQAWKDGYEDGENDCKEDL